jgi:Domain of unknown function (DUF4123)
MVEAIASEIFAEGLPAYVVLDGASIPELRQSLYSMTPGHECLYIGELSDDMAEVAPYLVELTPESPFTKHVFEQGWGKHWGIFAVSEAGIRDLRQHFRRFLTVYDPDGKAMLFRYYDPRVLRTYLPTCNAEETGKLFGPVKTFFAEGEKPDTMVKFEQNAGALVKRQVELGAR